MDFDAHYEFNNEYDDACDYEFDRVDLIKTEIGQADSTFDLFDCLNVLVGSTPSLIIYNFINANEDLQVLPSVNLAVMTIEDRFDYQVKNSEWLSRLEESHNTPENISISEWNKDVIDELERFSHKDATREFLIQNRIFGEEIDVIIIEYFGTMCKNCNKTEFEGDFHYENCREHVNFRPLPLVTMSPVYKGRMDPIFHDRLLLQDRTRLYEWINGDLIEYENPTDEDLDNRNELISKFENLLAQNKTHLLTF